jgi:3-dehydroquinate synthetase
MAVLSKCSRKCGVRENGDEYGNRCLAVKDLVDGRFVAYDVIMSQDLLNDDNPILEHYLNRAKVDQQNLVHVIFSASAFHNLGSKLRNYLNKHGITHSLISLPKQSISELNKTLKGLEHLALELDRRGVQKGDVLLVVGGGVAMDLAGFHASTWRRGGMLSYVALPTTLTAAIDAALSPKTAINLGNHKNYYGTNCAPTGVLVDNSLFATLNRQAILDGVAEMIKVAVAGDKGLFEILEEDGEQLIRENFQGQEGADVVWRAARLFLQLKWDDRFHHSPTSIRSFGHFFSRELEGISSYQLSHGQSVSIEMRIATHLGASIGQLASGDRDRILSCFDRLSLAQWADSIDCSGIWLQVFAKLAEKDKSFGFPIPVTIGYGGYLEWLGHDDLRRAMNDCRDAANGCVISTRHPS